MDMALNQVFVCENFLFNVHLSMENTMTEILYIYITIFAIYFVIYGVMISFPAKRIRDKYTPKDSNLCVVVYATGRSDTLDNLIKQLKNQNYPTENYTIYAILDKCEGISEVTLQSDLKVNVVSINNLEPIGKSQAYSIIAEKLYDVENLDAYVFLDSKNYVDADFLSNVNYYLTKYEVFNPTLTYLSQEGDLDFWQNVKMIYARFINKFISIPRTRLGLTNILNTDSFIIKKSLLNHIAIFDFRNIISELEYTIKLAKEGISVATIEDLRVYDSIDKFDFRIPSLSKRLGILFSNFAQPQTNISREMLLSQAAPNWLMFTIGFLFPLIHTHNFPAAISYSTVLLTFVIFLIAFVLGLLNMKFYPKEYLYLFAYPILSVGRLAYNFPTCRGIRNIFSKTTQKHTIEKMTTNVIITDGSRDIQAKMELISDNGLAKVTFINPNGKKYTTKNNHLRMIDALRELSAKLKDYGMTLKVCQNCKYFQTLVDGSTNMVKGTCSCQFEGRTPGDIIPTLVWNTCPNFEEQNVVSLF